MCTKIEAFTIWISCGTSDWRIQLSPRNE